MKNRDVVSDKAKARELNRVERRVVVGKLLAKNYTLTRIAEELGTSKQNVSHAVNGTFNSPLHDKIRIHVLSIINETFFNPWS